PHFFAGVAVSGPDDVALNWDEIKKAERAPKPSPAGQPASALDGVPFGQPGLSLVSQLQGRAGRAGVPDDLLAEGGPGGETAESLGAQLFPLVAAPRAAALDPGLELRAAARRYQ